MSRDSATTDAAVNGVVAVVILGLGGALASGLFALFDTSLAILPAFLVWLLFAYFALKQVAHGIYTLVEDVVED